MSEQIGKLKNKIKAVFAELRQFEEYVDGFLKETSLRLFQVMETQAALIEHLGCDKEVVAVIEKRQAEAHAERERIKAEMEEKRLQREADAQKIHEALGSDGLPNAN